MHLKLIKLSVIIAQQILNIYRQASKRMVIIDLKGCSLNRYSVKQRRKRYV